MNHNQIIHKLPPQLQTNNVAQSHVCLWAWVHLERMQQVDKLAQLAFGQPATENVIMNYAQNIVRLFTDKSHKQYCALMQTLRPHFIFQTIIKSQRPSQT